MKIVLDTNVLSEIMRPEPDERLTAWYRSVGPTELWTTTITIAELLFGLESMPEGRRRAELGPIIRGVVADFGAHTAPFDLPAAHRYADLAARRRRAGRPVDPSDAYIAAICLAQDATLATRNTKDFEGIGVDVVNPWTAQP